MKVLVSGDQGFIGKHLVEALKREGHEVQGFDIVTGSSILNLKRLEEAFDAFKPDVVSHLAAQATVESGEREPCVDALVNIVGTMNVLHACKKYGSKLVFHSSGAVYGNSKRIPTYEEVMLAPVSHYGVSKMCAEKYVEFYRQKGWVVATITRFSSVYGKGRDRGPINVFVDRYLQGKTITIFGTGEQTRDYTHVDDVVRGVIMCLEGKLPYGDTYNIASETLTSVNDIIRTIEQIENKPLKVIHSPEEVGDIHVNTFDCGKARVHGFKASIGLREGIDRLLKEMRATRMPTKDEFRLA